jgi:hypothetical protein
MKLYDGKYHLDNSYFHVADYLLFTKLTTYVYKYPFFLPRDNNDSNIQNAERALMFSNKNKTIKQKMIALYKNKRYTLSMRKSKRKTRKIKRKGGSRYFYANNTNPLRFTNQSNRQFGGSIGSILPVPIIDSIRGIGYSMSVSNAAMNGSYKGVDPDWRIQPLI